MFFFLSKLLHILVMPLFWIVFFWLLYVWRRHGKTARRYLLLAVSVSVFFTNTFIFKEFARLWEVYGVPIEDIEEYDYAIVLGGMFEYNSDLKTLSIRRGGDRIWQALRLFHRGKVKNLIISGSHGFVSDRGLDEARQLRDELVIWGIPDSCIYIDSLSKNTYENARETNKLIDHNNLREKSFLLVTSGMHMRRASACFRKFDLEITPYSTDLFTGPKRTYHWDEFIIPSISTADDWSSLTHEWVGYLTYKLMKYI